MHDMTVFEIDWMQEPKQMRRGDEVRHLISDNQEDDEMEKRERENKQTNYQLLMAFLLNSQYNMTDTRQVFFLFIFWNTNSLQGNLHGYVFTSFTPYTQIRMYKVNEAERCTRSGGEVMNVQNQWDQGRSRSAAVSWNLLMGIP